MSETEEIVVPYIVEDFEEGDRVYRYTAANDYSIFGTVKAVEDAHLLVIMDNTLEMRIPINCFTQVPGRGFYWGKPLPLHQVETGSRISLTVFGSKTFATVQRISPEGISYVIDGQQAATRTSSTSRDNTLEALMMYWELEG
jgi:hypothetical protein